METLQVTQSAVRVGWAFWLKWVLANAAASAISIVPAFIYPIIEESIDATIGCDHG